MTDHAAPREIMRFLSNSVTCKKHSRSSRRGTSSASGLVAITKVHSEVETHWGGGGGGGALRPSERSKGRRGS